MRSLTARDEAIVAAARASCVLFGRDDLVALTASGRDTIKFLHAMLTQDVKGLLPSGAASACLCDAQGAIIAVMHLVASEARAVLWTDRVRAEALMEGLDRFIIADDVNLELDDTIALCELVGPSAAEMVRVAAGAEAQAEPSHITVAGRSALAWRADLDGVASPWWPSTPRVWLQVARDDLGDVAGALFAAGAQPGSHAAREAIRVFVGEPRLGLDVDDGSLPLEVGLTGTVSFRKGCYLGQEAIAMMKYRGQPRRYLSWVAGEAVGELAPAPGWQLRTAEGKRAGRLGTCVKASDGSWRGLAVVPRKALNLGATLTVAPEADGGVAALTLVASTAPAAPAEEAKGATP